MYQPNPGACPKILFLTRCLDIGGAERQLVELATGLHAGGWKVLVASFYGGGAFEEPLRQAGIPVVDLRKRGRWDVLPFAFRLARLLRSERPQIVHGYLDVSNILLTLLRRVVPSARLVWGVRASNVDRRHYDMLCRLETRFGALLSRFADLIICNSEAGRRYHIDEGFAAGRMVVIPNGIDVQRFHPNVQARVELRAEWGVREDEKLVGIVARLDPMKDHETFLKAAAIVAASGQRVKFACVGDGNHAFRRELERLAQELGIAERVTWAAARHDVWRVYNALDLAVSASRFGEGFPNAVAEAMATGVPCVVTDVGDSAAIVADTGWICPPRDSRAMADAIGSALARLPGEARHIRERIQANYASAELLRRTGNQLSSLLETSSTAITHQT